MKKITICIVLIVVVLIAVLNFNISFNNGGYSLINSYSLSSVEALASEKTKCLVSSDSSKNIGDCVPAVNKEKGNVCVANGYKRNCYDHE